MKQLLIDLWPVVLIVICLLVLIIIPIKEKIKDLKITKKKK